MSASERLQQELLAASNKVLIQRAVKGSLLYPFMALVLFVLTDWRTQHNNAGLSFLALVMATATIRFLYLRWLLKRPDATTHGTPRGFTLVLLAPSLTYGFLAAATYSLFGLATATSALTIMLVFGFAAAGTSSLAMNRRTHTLFLVSLLVPLAICALAVGTRMGTATAVFVMVYMGFLSREGSAANASFVQLYERGFELQQAFFALETKQSQLVEAHDSMKLVMDNIEQGLCIVDTKGVIESHGSKAFDSWFGAAVPGTTLGSQLGDSSFADWFELSIEMLDEDILPAEVVIGQLPAMLVHGGRHLAFSYKAIERTGKTVGLLVVISDITERVAMEKAESDQRELAQLFQLLARDPDGFTEFRISAASLISAATETSSRVEQLHALHTLKGNAGLVGIASLAELCHELEDELADSAGPMEEEQAERLSTAWNKTESLMRGFLGEREDVIELSEAEYGQLIATLDQGAPHHVLSAMANDWRLESVPRRFERLAQHAERVGRSLGKEIQVHVDVPPLRLDINHWRDFWMACTHLLRNSVDHGIEDRETRVTHGKPQSGTVRLSAHVGDGEVVVRFADDGQGIDWSKVAAKAKSCGLPCDTQQALHAAIFSDRISTSDEVTTVSGRGIGLAAVAQETRRMDGTIEVRSTSSVGTEFIIRVPHRRGANGVAARAEDAA